MKLLWLGRNFMLWSMWNVMFFLKTFTLKNVPCSTGNKVQIWFLNHAIKSWEIFRLCASNWQEVCLTLLYLCLVRVPMLGLIKHLLIGWTIKTCFGRRGQPCASKCLEHLSISADVLLKTPRALVQKAEHPGVLSGPSCLQQCSSVLPSMMLGTAEVFLWIWSWWFMVSGSVEALQCGAFEQRLGSLKAIFTSHLCPH